MEAYLLLFGNKFSFIFSFFYLEYVMFCTCAMQFYRVSGRAGAIITFLLFI